MSNILQNLKIMVENDQDEMIDVDQNDDLIGNNNTKILLDSGKKIDQYDINETEFHVNLDKVPSTLKNTVLNEKIYLNESLKEDDQANEIDLDSVSPEDLKKLYESLDISESNFVSSSTDLSLLSDQNNLSRKEALHIFGVDELTTDDIFAYFKKYKPFAVEWINDSSCNVVWKNENHAINALLGMSIPYEDAKHNELAGKGERKPPQGSKWRLSARSAKGYHVYMRFVRMSDKKRKGAESRSRFYVKYGNPNYNNIKGLISSSKRRMMRQQQLSDAHEDLVDDDSVDSYGRKLVSYNIDNDINDLEEFGTSKSNKLEKTNASKFTRDRSRSPIQTKKMQLYSDEIEEKSLKDKRRNRFGLESSDGDLKPQTKNSFDIRNRLSNSSRYGGGSSGKNYERDRNHHYHQDRRSYMDEEDDYRSNNRNIKSRLGRHGDDRRY